MQTAQDSHDKAQALLRQHQAIQLALIAGELPTACERRAAIQALLRIPEEVAALSALSPCDDDGLGQYST